MAGYIGATSVSFSVTEADIKGDIKSTDASPEVTLQNTTEEDTDGGRESKITFKGEQSGGEITTLAQIQASHDGTADDEKGDLIFSTNDGADGNTPTERMRVDGNGDITFYEDTGATPKFFWDASAQSLEINGASDARDHSLVVSGDDDGGVTSDLQRWKTGLDGGKNLNLTYDVNDNNFDFDAGDRNLTFTTSGNVGIGTSSPDTPLEVKHTATSDAIKISGNADGVSPYLSFENQESGTAYVRGRIRGASNGVDGGLIFQTGSSGSMSEAMRIDSSGSVMLGTTTLVGHQSGNVNSAIGLYQTGQFAATSNGANDYTAYINKRDNTSGGLVRFRYNGSDVGSITNTTSSVSYNTSSDYRLKENVTDVTDGITRVKQLAPKRFNFIADPDTTVDGFLAHEAAVAVPEAVTGTKDAMRDEEYEVTPAVLDDDGNVVTEAVMGTRSVPDYQGIDQSKLVPLLTAALQEAIAKIETLETKVAALESA